MSRMSPCSLLCRMGLRTRAGGGNRCIVRIPIARAMQMTVEAYQNPAQARSNLIARAQKAAEPLPQPSFE